MTDQEIIEKATRIMASTPPANLIQALANAGLLNPWSSVEEEQVRAEKAEAERDEVAGRLGLLLWELTDGRLSKTGYDVPTMVREVESVFEKHAERDRALIQGLYETIDDAHAATRKALDECGQLRQSRAELADEVQELRERVTRTPDRLQQAEAERDALAASIQRVRELHQPHQHSVFDCAFVFKGDCAYTDRCRICREDYPCPTIRALDDPQEQP